MRVRSPRVQQVFEAPRVQESMQKRREAVCECGQGQNRARPQGRPHAPHPNSTGPKCGHGAGVSASSFGGDAEWKPRRSARVSSRAGDSKRHQNPVP
eukprot:scaffold2479_cov146-Isochrysis_galbana.AAC.2